jgi:hypothetical protein
MLEMFFDYRRIGVKMTSNMELYAGFCNNLSLQSLYLKKLLCYSN